ncbi:MAG: alpha/beta hydrolase [Acidobacteriota bacterium]
MNCVEGIRQISAAVFLLTLIFSHSGRAQNRVEEGYVTADDGARLFYRKTGSGKQAVVIPLGFMLFEEFKRLAVGRTLIFYDMRNRGRSDSISDDSRITIQHDVDDLEKLRQHFGFDKVSLIGESYLGLMVVMYAMKHPQRVDRIVQIGAVPRKFDTQYPAHLMADDRDAILDQNEVNKLLKLKEDGYDKTNPRDYCEKQWMVTRMRLVGKREDAPKVGKGYCDYENEWPINFERHLQAHFTSVQKLDIPKEELKKVSNPVLTIHGTKDRNAPYGSGREWALILPNARLITVEGAAHLPWIEAPDLVFSSIDAFLKGRWPAKAERVKAL